jgi:apolipoprotein N-acyltransferase
VGVSAFVDAAGNVYDATQFNAKAVIGRDVTLGSTRTIATKLGVVPELVLTGMSLGVLVAGVALKRLRRRVEG